MKSHTIIGHAVTELMTIRVFSGTMWASSFAVGGLVELVKGDFDRPVVKLAECRLWDLTSQTHMLHGEISNHNFAPFGYLVVPVLGVRKRLSVYCLDELDAACPRRHLSASCM